MRYATIILSCIMLIVISCKKENLAPTVKLEEMADSSAVVQYSGDFTSGPYGNVTGKAEIFKQGTDYGVMLTDFTTSNGPALHVYISKEAMPVNYIDLGALKSTSGNQLYPVTGMPDFMDYKYVAVHCVAYNHLFGWALVKK